MHDTDFISHVNTNLKYMQELLERAAKVENVSSAFGVVVSLLYSL